MQAGAQYPAGPHATGHSTPAGPPPEHYRRSGQHRRHASPAWLTARSGRAALLWIAGAAGVLILYLRISSAIAPSSDVANNALQAWDLLHGHLLLHGWVIGDATYYTFDLPVLAVSEALLGFGTSAAHLALALIYLSVTALAVAIAVTDSRGAARVTRAAVVVAVLAAPALVTSDRWVPLGLPDHTGTIVFLLGSALLLDRAPGRRWTAPLLAVILAAGQIGDVTVRYVVVPAIVAVYGLRVLRSRRLRSYDGVILLTAVASVPLSLAIRKVMLFFHSYLMVSPKTSFAPVRKWPHNAALTWHALRLLFGAQAAPGWRSLGILAIFGSACMLAAAIGLLLTVRRWRTARVADQVLVMSIAVNLAVYLVSTLPAPNSPHDIVGVLAASAVLAARGLVPARIAGRPMALAAGGVALIAALLPLSLAAAKPASVSRFTPLAAWLQEHGYHYGIAGYWDSSSVTLLTGNQLQIRTVELSGGKGNKKVTTKLWETNTLWFEPSRHYANFLVISLTGHDLPPAAAKFFGKPTGRYHVTKHWEVLTYNRNLLKQVKKAPMPPVS